MLQKRLKLIVFFVQKENYKAKMKIVSFFSSNTKSVLTALLIDKSTG